MVKIWSFSLDLEDKRPLGIIIYPTIDLNFFYQNDGQYLNWGRIMLVREFLDLVVIHSLDTGPF